MLLFIRNDCTSASEAAGRMLVEEGLLGHIAMDDSSSSSYIVLGRGDIVTNYGKLENVLYVPGLAQNLFSILAAAAKGLSHVGTKDKLTFYHKERELFSAQLQKKLYLIRLDVKGARKSVERVNAATLEEWHSRFRHISKETITKMKELNVVDGLDIVVASKQTCQD